MIAASEAFLSRTRFGGPYSIHSSSLHLSAMRMGEMLHERGIGKGFSAHHDDAAFIGAGLGALQLAGIPRSGGGCPKFAGTAVRHSIDLGMPFVGWSIGADTRRIVEKAQPGEGDFIKYLGRD